MRCLTLFISLFLLTLCIPGCRKMTGVKVYHIEKEFGAQFDEWDDLGINTVLASPNLFNEQFTGLAKKHDIQTFIIIPVFYDPEILSIHPEWYAITDQGAKAVDDWVQFICPSGKEYRKGKIEYVCQLVKEHQPDGISLDFIRFFSFWEKVYPDRNPDSIPNTCFCPVCLEKFRAETNITIPGSLVNTEDIAGWIETNHLAEWTEWKCNLITSMVRDIVIEAKKIDPDLIVNLHAVPWRQYDFDNGIRRVVGQDLPALAEYVDMISPMTYSHMVKREPEWIHSVVKDMKGQVSCKVIPSIQVNEAYLNEVLTPGEFEKCLHEALRTPSSGVFLWSWEQLDSRPEKKEIFKKAISF